MTVTGAQIAAAMETVGQGPDATAIAGGGFEDALAQGVVHCTAALPEQHQCSVVRREIAAALLMGLMVGLELRDV